MKNNDIITHNNISGNNIISNDNNENCNDNETEKEEIKLFYDSLTDLLFKKQYKKIIKLLSLKEEEDEKTENEQKEENINESQWILQFIKAISIQKIVEKKNVKYYKSPIIPKFKEYIEKENKIINKWLLFIKELITNKKHNKYNNKDYIQCFLEFIVTFILKKISNLSKHCIYQEKYKEAVCFLSLGINLINNSYSFFKSPESFLLCGEIYLFLSSILIGDNNNYKTAKNIISLSCKFFYICMESLLFSNPNCVSYSIFNIKIQEKKNYDIINKIFFYLSLSFYHLGICYENEGFPYSSFYAYKQSKYFASIIKERSSDIHKFYEFLKEIEKRQLLRNRIIIFFEKFVKKEDLIDKEPQAKNRYKTFNSHREMKRKRFKILEQHISNMKLIDIDKDEPQLFDKINKHYKYNVNLATKQIHLLDYLMSDNFKETIKSMNNIRINKLDKETIEIIQKKIIEIKNNEREKLELKIKSDKSVKNKNNKSTEIVIKEKEHIKSKIMRTISSPKTFNSEKKTRVSSSYKNSNILITDANNNSLKTESCFSFNSRPTTANNDKNYKSPWKYYSLKNLSKRNKILIQEKEKNDNNLFNEGDKILLSASSKNVNNKNLKYKVKKYTYDKFLLSHL